MKPPKAASFEAVYPTKKAREKADELFDELPLETPIGEAIRLWDRAYLAAGGIVNLKALGVRR